MVDSNTILIFDSMLERDSSVQKYWKINIRSQLIAMIDNFEQIDVKKNFTDSVILENIDLLNRISELENEVELLHKAYEVEVRYGK